MIVIGSSLFTLYCLNQFWHMIETIEETFRWLERGKRQDTDLEFGENDIGSVSVRSPDDSGSHNESTEPEPIQDAAMSDGEASNESAGDAMSDVEPSQGTQQNTDLVEKPASSGKQSIDPKLAAYWKRFVVPKPEGMVCPKAVAKESQVEDASTADGDSGEGSLQWEDRLGSLMQETPDSDSSPQPLRRDPRWDGTERWVEHGPNGTVRHCIPASWANAHNEEWDGESLTPTERGPWDQVSDDEVLGHMKKVEALLDSDRGSASGDEGQIAVDKRDFGLVGVSVCHVSFFGHGLICSSDLSACVRQFCLQ